MFAGKLLTFHHKHINEHTLICNAFLAVGSDPISNNSGMFDDFEKSHSESGHIPCDLPKDRQRRLVL